MLSLCCWFMALCCGLSWTESSSDLLFTAPSTWSWTVSFSAVTVLAMLVISSWHEFLLLTDKFNLVNHCGWWPTLCGLVVKGKKICLCINSQYTTWLSPVGSASGLVDSASPRNVGRCCHDKWPFCSVCGCDWGCFHTVSYSVST